ncbi:hypothetical protein QBC39DRAFT_375121 [Podospora conica]|nr:hypothetical protein QBC39DRAFT_375121 [Schizothecium conicum]
MDQDTYLSAFLEFRPNNTVQPSPSPVSPDGGNNPAGSSSDDTGKPITVFYDKEAGHAATRVW